MPRTCQYVLLIMVCLVLLVAWQSEAAGAVFEVPVGRVAARDAVPGKGPGARLVVRSTYFREMARGARTQSCQANLQPVPLTTPLPMINSTDSVRLKVSFVVGIDGRVYGPLTLEGMRPGTKASQARPLLEAVRQWRFRPAVCNGAPTEAEAKVEFSSPSNRF